MNAWCEFAALFGLIGMVCSTIAISLAAKTKRRAHCRWCGLNEAGVFDSKELK